MKQKTDAVRREIIRSIIERYGNKGKKVLVSKMKDAGVYKNFVDDNEVYNLLVKFAEFHNLIILSDQQLQDIEDRKQEKIEVIKEQLPTDNEDDYFLQQLEKQHRILSKKLLALNKLIESYKSE